MINITDYSFLKSEWFYVLCTLVFMMIIEWVKGNKQIAEEMKQSLDKHIENNLRLKSEFRQNWSRIAAFPGDNKESLRQHISAIKSDEMKTSIYHVIDILFDVHNYYEQKKMNIDESNWRKSFVYVFNPNKMTAIVSAYEKYKKAGQFSCSFEKYVDNVINKQKVQEKSKVA